MKPVVDGRYSGLFASTGWNRRQAWSPFRKDEVRALQRVSAEHQSTLGDIPGIFETMFHRILGPSGISDSELATSAERAALVSKIRDVEAYYPKMGPADLMDAVEAVAAARRLSNTFPETPSEIAEWRAQADAMTKRLDKFLPSVWPWVVLGGVGIGAALFAPAIIKAIKK